MKVLKIGLLLVAGILIGYIFFYAKFRSTMETTEPSKLWNTSLGQNFTDEPQENDFKVNDSKISSTSNWFVPPDPSVISFDPIQMWPVAQVLTNVDSFQEKDWNKYPTFKEELIKQNLEPKYQALFLKEGKVPDRNLTKNVDINGDGNNDMIFQSYGVGCVSCHVNFVDIFVNDKRYVAFTNEGKIYPRQDNKGFYTTDAYTGENYATCCADNYIVSKYEWNGNGFTEVARKSVTVAKDD